MRLAISLLIAGTSFSPTMTGAEPKPVPLMQAIPQAHEQVTFERNALEIARYHYGADLKRPFVFPLIGPAGRSVTRMGHPRDPQTHSHHNSVWISHESVNGANFWGDASGAELRTCECCEWTTATTRRMLSRKMRGSIRRGPP
jgi:hypothetical protein